MFPVNVGKFNGDIKYGFKKFRIPLLVFDPLGNVCALKTVGHLIIKFCICRSLLPELSFVSLVSSKWHLP